MKKKNNWKVLLNEHLLKTLNRPFRFGRHDCCVSVTRILTIITGENVLQLFERYTTVEGARKLREQFGGVTGLAKHVADTYGVDKIPVSRATEGDIVVVEQRPGEFSLGVVGLGGRHIYAASSPKGWATVPLKEAVVAYRIP